ncbi:hypothetical protein [Actinoplanes friuliensis]|uniref:Protein kinase domain-containing protein n=1 Tax=Actinoplanes friuliensis DSM 7358 TaxID=1246995 RepID=U5W9Z4_9ACTN|nr:hypothetical protein [Actinoplanes friuliensis]AGZ44800.1 hypothetical protein AFR_32710 [Actinoplanes friuliensis DSM 7358]
MRVERHREAGRLLGELADDALAELVDGAVVLRSGIGGRTALLDLDGIKVFVKRIPLTDLERQPRHVGSTANLFGLPTFYQYGVGSTGFGAWRELATHVKTTGWVVDGVSEHFPLLHHWRVLPATPVAMPDFGDWDGDPAVRRRVAAISEATSSIVLFLEYLPWSLHEWLLIRFDAGDGERAVTLADRQLHAGTELLRERGIVHFDAHPGNVLTDGEQLYFSDFGLALDQEFERTPAEAAFQELHRDWDRYDVERYLVNWLCERLAPDVDRTEVIRSGGAGLPEFAAAVVRRYGPAVLVLNDFYGRLVAGPKTTPFPLEELKSPPRHG